MRVGGKNTKNLNIFSFLHPPFIPTITSMNITFLDIPSTKNDSLPVGNDYTQTERECEVIFKKKSLSLSPFFLILQNIKISKLIEIVYFFEVSELVTYISYE